MPTTVCRRYFHSDQAPAFWSPDGDAVLLRIGTNDPNDPEPAAAVLRTDGTLTTVPPPSGSRNAANPVGWIDENHIALVRGRESTGQVRVWIIDIRTGRSVRDFLLDFALDVVRPACADDVNGRW